MRRSPAPHGQAPAEPIALATCCICEREGKAGPEIVPTAARRWVCRAGDCRAQLIARAA